MMADWFLKIHIAETGTARKEGNKQLRKKNKRV